MGRTILLLIAGTGLFAAGIFTGSRWQTPSPADAAPEPQVLMPWGDPAEEPPMFQLDPVEPIGLESPKLSQAEVSLNEIEARLSLPQPARVPTELVEGENRFAKPTSMLEQEDQVELGVTWSLDHGDGKVKVDENGLGGILKGLKTDKAKPKPAKSAIWETEPE